MMVSSTRCLASSAHERWARLRRVACLLMAACLLLLTDLRVARAAELTALRTDRTEEGIYLSANVRFELPAVIEEALLKGLALIFVFEAEIYRERWYWTDQRVATASRSLRLAYQPLTRRWRLSQGSEASGGGPVALAQTYDTLPEALAAIARTTRWRIADPGDVDASNHVLLFRFRLDLSALPRPFQIGIAGQREWQIALERTQRLRLERRATDPQPADR